MFGYLGFMSLINQYFYLDSSIKMLFVKVNQNVELDYKNPIIADNDLKKL